MICIFSLNDRSKLYTVQFCHSHTFIQCIYLLPSLPHHSYNWHSCQGTTGVSVSCLRTLPLMLWLVNDLLYLLSHRSPQWTDILLPRVSERHLLPPPATSCHLPFCLFRRITICNSSKGLKSLPPIAKSYSQNFGCGFCFVLPCFPAIIPTGYGSVTDHVKHSIKRQQRMIVFRLN